MSGFGVAGFIADETLEDLLSRADAGLYRAKRAGCDRVVAAQASDPTMKFTQLARPRGLTHNSSYRPGLRTARAAMTRDAVDQFWGPAVGYGVSSNSCVARINT